MSLYEELRHGSETEASGRIQGILLGEVTDNWDSAHPGMVKVQLLLGTEQQNELDWVPVASPYAGNGYGAYLLPEIGAQVIVAFYMGHPESPYVIGCLWNRKNVLPEETARENNTVKRLLTKGGNSIEISDEEGKEKLTVRTRAGSKLELDDENQKLLFMDGEGKNSIAIDAGEGTVCLKAEKKLVLAAGDKEMAVLDGEEKKLSLAADNIRAEAGQKLELKGQNTSLEGSSTEIRGQNIKAQAQASLALKGTASFKAESSGMFEAKGQVMKLG
ncbi:MAG: phage baseplate assembly protein V [Blautia sp.]|nr:phage baseplate assembly protein V [Blautia sp.]